MTRGIFALALLLAPTLLPTPQGGPITIPLSPTPNQTIRTHTSQETTMTSEQEVPAGQAIPPQILHTTMTMDSTMTVGPSDEHGRYDAHVVLQSIEATSTMNDKPMTIPKPNAGGLAFTMSYDEHGKTIDMTGDSGPGADAAAAIKQMMASAMTTPAPLTLAVGESVTVPNQLRLPLSGGGSSAGGGSMTTTGETRYTLSSITFDGADRIAHLTTKRTATMSGSPGSAAVQTTLEEHWSAAGTIDVNIDRGITIHSSERVDIDGTSRIVMRGSPERSMRTHGTTTLTLDLVK